MTRNEIVSTFLTDYRYFRTSVTLIKLHRASDCYALGYFYSRCCITRTAAQAAGLPEIAERIERAQDAAHRMLGFGVYAWEPDVQRAAA